MAVLDVPSMLVSFSGGATEAVLYGECLAFDASVHERKKRY